MDTLKPILIAGPTASGKSALALELATSLNGAIINADALQVYDHWQVLTARPDDSDLALAPHYLYGHVPATETYSVGAWLRDLANIRARIRDLGLRPIIIGGTGLYFSALTQGLADIPEVPADIRARADVLYAEQGLAGFAQSLRQRDPDSFEKLDQNNPARLQRAWEVLEATGIGLSAWQTNTGPAALRLGDCVPLVLDADRDWLADRIARRFTNMVGAGALDEVRRWRDSALPRSVPAARALGAPELLDYLDGRHSLETACARAVIVTRQFAKRQRSWFRNRMADWHRIDLAQANPEDKAMQIINA